MGRSSTTGKKGNKVEFVGTESVEGTDTLKVKVTLKGGDVRIFYLDTDYYVPIKIVSKRTVRGAEREYEMILGDYKQVAGIYVPHSIETNAKGSPEKQKLTYDTIEANVPLDDSRFRLPGSQAKETKPPAPVLRESPTERPDQVKPAAGTPPPSTRAKLDSETISGLGARNIGSAAMSGRVAALDAGSPRVVRSGEIRSQVCPRSRDRRDAHHHLCDCRVGRGTGHLYRWFPFASN